MPLKEDSAAPAGKAQTTQGSGAALSLYEANVLVAKLAGFWGRRSDGHPGPDVLGRGLQLLAAVVEFLKFIQDDAAPPSKPPRRSRKPG